MPSDTAAINGYVNAAHDTAAQTLTGSAEDGSTVTIYDNDAQVGATAADAATGAWSLPIGVLADGSTQLHGHRDRRCREREPTERSPLSSLSIPPRQDRLWHLPIARW